MKLQRKPKTVKEFLNSLFRDETLRELAYAIASQLGFHDDDPTTELKSAARDIIQSGARAGHRGFTYTRDILEFVRNNAYTINDALYIIYEDYDYGGAGIHWVTLEDAVFILLEWFAHEILIE